METKIFYAVQHGDNYDWDNGSYNYAEAQEMARDLSKEFPGEEIRIAHIDEDCNFCEKTDVIVEGSKYAVIAVKRGDYFEKFFVTEAEALQVAEDDWHDLTDYDKKLHTAFYVCSCKVEDGIVDYDTVSVIKDFVKES